MTVEKHDVWMAIIEAIYVLLATIFIIQMILKILGHSPVDAQVFYGGFATVVVVLFGVLYRLNYKLGRIDEKLVHIGHLRKGFEELRDDFGALRKDFEGLRREFGVTNQKLSAVEHRLTAIEHRI